MILWLAALGTLVLALAATRAAALGGAALLGVGLGSEADVLPYLMANYFGRKHFCVLYGLTWTAYAIGGGPGPCFWGISTTVLVRIGLQAVASLAVFALPQPWSASVCDARHAIRRRATTTAASAASPIFLKE